MQITIRVSRLMSERSKCLGSSEDRYVRIPLELRELCCFTNGDFVTLKPKSGDLISLKVSMAYKNDAENGPKVACVTQNVFDLLHLEDFEQKYEYEINVVEGILLGCDPEFFLADKKDMEILSARRLFKKFGQIGNDGVLMEIRPLPFTNEVDVVNNMYDLIKRARNIINTHEKVDGNNVVMVAASYYKGVPAGFHLHFGLPYQLLGNKLIRQAVQKQIVRALDYYVGIPSIIPEGENDHTRRTSQHVVYGKPGEAIVDNRTLEYKVPGGSLMRHPDLAVGILGLGAIVVEDIVSRISACTNSFNDLKNVSSAEDLKEIYPNVPDIFELFQTICSKDLTQAKKHLDVIINDISQMVGFSKRETSIKEYFRRIYYDTDKFSPYLEENWENYFEE